jgi:hypothetical protein
MRIYGLNTHYTDNIKKDYINVNYYLPVHTFIIGRHSKYFLSLKVMPYGIYLCIFPNNELFLEFICNKQAITLSKEHLLYLFFIRCNNLLISYLLLIYFK